MSRRLVAAVGLVLAFAAGSSVAANDEAFQARVRQLEAETAELRSQLDDLRKSVGTGPQPISVSFNRTAALPGEEAAAIIESLRPEIAAEAKKAAWTKGEFKIVPYGFLWASMISQTERTTPGSYTLWVPSSDDQGESAFFLDARRTRLGLNVEGPTVPFFHCATSSGTVEIDFQSPVTSDFENRATVQLRHAYWEVKDDNFRFLVGQNWDIVSPLFPSTLSYSVGWDGGNIGYRRPLVRLDRHFYPTETLKLTGEFGLAADVVTDLATVTGVRRETSNWPVLEARIAATLGSRGEGHRNVVIGFSGHVGEQGFDFYDTIPAALNPLGLPAEDDVRLLTWSMNMDLTVPISERMTFKGEYFNGANLGTFLGGIGQGVCPCFRQPIRANGGWMELGYDLTSRWHSFAGFGIDDPNVEADALLGRKYNQFLFTNMNYDLTKKLNVGLEITFWKTLYYEARPGLTTPAPGESAVFEFVARYGF
jgi:hypothetical protein